MRLDAPIQIEHPLLEGGYFMTLGDDGSSVFCYRQVDGVHLSYTVHAASERELSEQAPGCLLERIQHDTRCWHQPIPEIVAQSDPASLVVRGYYDKEPARQVGEGRVWLIGDAAHPMCPFQGQGANMAMLDALQLAQWLAARAGDGVGADPNGLALEADVVARGRRAVLESRNSAGQFHTRSRFKQTTRNAGFRMASLFIGLFNRPRTAR